MSHSGEEKKSRDLMVRLFRALDYIEVHQHNNKIDLPEPSIDPDSYFYDIPEGFYDEDLLDIQSMNSEDVESELAAVGYDKETIVDNLKFVNSDNVIKFPKPKTTSEEIAAWKLGDNIFSSIFKEALGKSYMLKKSDETPNHNQLTKAPVHTKRPVIKNDRYMQKAALILVTCLFTSLAIASAKPIMRHIDRLLIAYDVRNNPEIEKRTIRSNLRLTNSISSRLNFDQLDLNYENATNLLDKIRAGEVFLTTEEKRSLFDKMYTLAKADQQKLKKTDIFYDERRACTESKLYRYVVRAGDTIGSIINECGFTVNHDLSGITEILNIDDIVLFKVNNNYELIRIDIDKNKKNGIKNLFNPANH